MLTSVFADILPEPHSAVGEDAAPEKRDSDAVTASGWAWTQNGTAISRCVIALRALSPDSWTYMYGTIYEIAGGGEGEGELPRACVIYIR